MIELYALQEHYKKHIRPYLQDEGKNWSEMNQEDIIDIERHYILQIPRCYQKPKLACDCLSNCGDDESFQEMKDRKVKQIAACLEERMRGADE